MGIRYVVRGATLSCSSGSSSSRLNMPRSHGKYVNGKPIVNDSDTAAGANIKPFGKCSVLDGPCSPAPAGTWKGTQIDTLVSGCPAVIADSTLSCNVGGCITVENDGQQG
ncbi:hypothetical protein SRRS_11800 [Sporomusa rhizae]|uniref:DUF4280 domain-containing protein n=1 Tax=Sporomusa rhizae TaxID=357999 RepID=UPI00352A0959